MSYTFIIYNRINIFRVVCAVSHLCGCIFIQTSCYSLKYNHTCICVVLRNTVYRFLPTRELKKIKFHCIAHINIQLSIGRRHCYKRFTPIFSSIFKRKCYEKGQNILKICFLFIKLIIAFLLFICIIYMYICIIPLHK